MPGSGSVAIVGGGITGLAAAWWLRTLCPQVRITLIEAGNQLGGVLRTDRIEGYLIEQSADMFSTEPSAAIDLIQRLGRQSELVSTLPVTQRAYVATGNSDTIEPVPQGFSLMLPNDLQAVLVSGLLDESGRKRFEQERHLPARMSDEDESVEAFAVRRFGQQAFDRLIQPLVSGIYTADPKRLSMQATMARFLELERRHGSLIQAAAAVRRESAPKNSKDSGLAAASPSAAPDCDDHRLVLADQTASGARYDLFRAPRDGMGQLLDWIVSDLQRVEIIRQAAVVNLRRSETGWQLILEKSDSNALRENDEVDFLSGNERRALSADGVLICCAPTSAARLIAPHQAELARQLNRIESASCAVVVFGLEKRQFRQNFGGYGIVVPAYLQQPLIAASCSSNKFPNRSAPDRMLFRCFLGGALNPNVMAESDADLSAIALSGLGWLLPFEGQPELSRVYRWKRAMPQYHLGHLQQVAQIRACVKTLPGLDLAGNSYNGVGIPVCIAESRAAAERMLDFLRKST